jgi:hypothetical protein
VPELPRYVVVGRGRWARRILDILVHERRQTRQVAEARSRAGESDADYKSRLSDSFRASGAHIAWLCVPPGEHLPLMLEAVMDAGLHAVVEKPWLCSRRQSAPLLAAARASRLIIGVHFEYCLLDAVEAWRRDFRQGADLQFGGCFTLSRPQRLPISPLHDLGSHLLSIRAYAVPQSGLSEIRCGYDLADERRVWLESSGRPVASIDFLENREPVIQRFVSRFEEALSGVEFPFDLDFALRVADDVRALK